MSCYRVVALGFGMLLGVASTARHAGAFQIFTVGAGCPYATIQEALTASYYSPGEDYVWIVNNTSYTGQHITIADQDVDIEGGFTDCNDFDIGPNDTTTISGAGNDGGPVFDIGGTSHVYLGNLVITGAQRTGQGLGGGISFIGNGSVALGNTTVSFNQANVGGGIYVSATGTGYYVNEARLTLLANTLILSNSATLDGGGIAVSSQQVGASEYFLSTLYASDDSTLIAYNSAGRRGGGIFVGNDAIAYVASPGYGSLGAIFDNSANQGGGIAAYVDRLPALQYPSAIELFSVDPARPVRIQNNAAAQSGGGVYLSQLSIGTLNTHPRVCLEARDFRIDENVAPEGAAIHAQKSTGTVNAFSYGTNDMELNNNICGVPSAGIAAAACASGVVCNSIDHNVDEDGLGNPTSGATVLFETDGELHANRVSLRHNTGYDVIRTEAYGAVDAGIAITNVLLADNTATSNLLEFEGTQQPLDIALFNATITNNSTSSAYVAYTESNLDLYNSIIDQPGVLTVAYAGPPYGLYAGWDLSNDTSTLGGGGIQGTPTFVDAAGGDYHLRPWSPGVDVATQDDGYNDGTDLDGNPRVKDLTSVPNTQGFGQDIGAYELQYVCAPDEVFCGGFQW